MAESTLNLTYSELKAEIGFFLGWGRGADYSEPAWTARQTQGIEDALKSGLRMFYFPTMLPGDDQSYQWSFMRPTRQQTFATGETEIDLPDDFAGMEGSVHLVDSERIVNEIRQTNEQMIYKKRSELSDVTGQPEMCAVQVGRTTTATRGQRAKLLFWPTADQDYTVQYQYYFAPDSLSVSFPYSLGGPTHAETIKAACKAAAELHQNNEKGVQNELFIDRMRASVSLDRRNKSQTLGYNADRTYNQGRPGNLLLINFIRTPITFNGVSPG